MEKFKDIKQVLDFAISNEEDAYAFYTKLASEQTNPAIKELFTMFAKEEQTHKQKLENAKKGNLSGFTEQKIQNLNISEYMLEIEPNANLDYQETLILAMQKEKKAFLLYTHLADITNDISTKSLFLILAQEEAKHKLRFEIEYDNTMLSEN